MIFFRKLKIFTAFSVLILFVLANTYNSCQSPTMKKAVVIMDGQYNGNIIYGVVEITEINLDVVNIVGIIKGLYPNSIHGFHVHQFGDPRDSCMKSGAHYNPFNKKHGGPHYKERHVGDLGNVYADLQGNIDINIFDQMVKLSGNTSVIGRALVLHEKKDNYTAQPAGDAGSRIACGVIGIMVEN